MTPRATDVSLASVRGVLVPASAHSQVPKKNTGKEIKAHKSHKEWDPFVSADPWGLHKDAQGAEKTAQFRLGGTSII